MHLMLKWLISALIILSGIVVLGSIVIYVLLRGSLPDYSSVHRVKGIVGPVEIVRDNFAIPHIFGDTDKDVFFGLGFAHAQDRLWQMSLLRRTAYGRLSEVFGTVTLRTDRFMRMLDIHKLSVDALKFQDEDTRAALDAYSKGVNAWMQIVAESTLNSGAPEFLLFDEGMRPWEPFDSIAILNLQALDLTGHALEEARRMRAAAKLEPDRLADLMPFIPGSGIAVPYTLDVNSESSSVAPENHFPSFSRSGLKGASNVWAAAPARTASQATLFANDPHLAFSAPSIWMLARLELSSGGVIGATIPGSPIVPIGRSAQIAWGITISYLDDQDLYFEQLDPESDDRYLTPTGNKEFGRRIDIIKIKDQPPEQLELRRTENGPVISNEYFGLSQIIPRDHVATLAFTLLDPQNTSMTAGLRLMKAQTVDEALEAGRLHRAPSLNLLIADRNEIAMQVIGAAPRRHIFHDTKGILPSEGRKLWNRWQGELKYEELPRFRNPTDGLLANTNNKTVDREFPYHLTQSWGDIHRYMRLEQLLAAQEVHSRNSFASIQLDTVSNAAITLVPLLARNLWHTTGAAGQTVVNKARNAALDLLSDWDGDMDAHQAEPLIYAAWVAAVQRLLIQDELGNLTSEFRKPDPVFIERVFKNIDGAAVWCDIIQTEVVENCDDIALIALDEAVSQLLDSYGSDLASWQWGDAHMAIHDNPVLTSNSLLSWLFDIRQPVSGGDHTLNNGAMATSGENPFAGLHGPGYRGIYDFSEPDSSQFVIATGQSGHPLSQHFDDLSQLWRSGQYAVMSLDPAYSRANAVGITTLEPVSP